MAKYNAASFTGHRTIKYEHKAILPKLLYETIEQAYNDGCKKFYTGGALGFDTMAADAVLKLRETHPDVELHLILPCHDQDRAWRESDREILARTMLSADSVRYTGEEYTPYCMKVRNQALVDECDLLIAYYYRDRSGTSQTVGMARRGGKDVCNLAQLADTLI